MYWTSRKSQRLAWSAKPVKREVPYAPRDNSKRTEEVVGISSLDMDRFIILPLVPCFVNIRALGEKSPALCPCYSSTFLHVSLLNDSQPL
jgi:hypothetical protein